MPQLKFYDDKGNMVLTENAEAAKLILGSIQSVWVCPYCIWAGKINDFLFMDKKDRLSKKRRCPDCKAEYLAKSLTMANTIHGLVVFLRLAISYPSTREKVRWGKIKTRLRERGIAPKFWDDWYKTKWKRMTDEEKHGLEWKDYREFLDNKDQYEGKWEHYVRDKINNVDKEYAQYMKGQQTS